MHTAEAIDLNTALDWLFGNARIGARPPSDDEAREALGRLADRAHRALSSGMNREDVDGHWRVNRPRPLGERRAKP